MAANREPQDATKPATRDVAYYRGRPAWGWGLAALVILIGLVAIFAWDWRPYGTPATTGTIAPPAAPPPASAPATQP